MIQSLILCNNHNLEINYIFRLHFIWYEKNKPQVNLKSKLLKQAIEITEVKQNI